MADETNATPDKAGEFLNLSREEKRAKLAVILDRGIVGHRLSVGNLPPDVYGEWVRATPMDIDRMRAMGFEVDRKYTVGHAQFDDGTGVPKVGDVVFMTAPMEVKEIIDEIRLKKFIEMNGNPKTDKRREQAEERTVVNNQGFPVINESSEATVTRDQIEAVLNKKE